MNTSGLTVSTFTSIAHLKDPINNDRRQVQNSYVLRKCPAALETS